MGIFKKEVFWLWFPWIFIIVGGIVLSLLAPLIMNEEVPKPVELSDRPN